MTHIRFRILGALFVVSFVNYLLRNNFSVAVPAIKAEFQFTNEQIGWILFSFNLAYTLFQIPGGLFGDRVGPRRAFLMLAVGWGAITALTGFIPDLMAATAGGAFVGFVLVRAAMGVTHAPMFPVAAATNANWFPPGHWAFPNSLLSSGLTLGQAATGPVVSSLITFFGWRGSFWALAPLGFITAIAWWLHARDTPALHPKVDAAERAFIGLRAKRGVGEGAAPPWHSALFQRDVLLVAGSYFCMNVVFLLFSQWLYQYLVEERGFSALESGWLYMLPFIVGAVFASLGGLTCDRLCVRLGTAWGHRLPAIVGLVLVAVLLIAGAEAPNPYVAVGLLALCFGFTQFTEGIYWSATTFAAGPYTATATGLLNTAGNVAGFLAPLIGILLDRVGWHATFALGSAFAVLAAVLWLFVGLKTVPAPSGRIASL